MNANVSVVIPTWNRRIFLEAAVESVRRQTVSVRELIVVDDGSSDGTKEWCKAQPDVVLLSTFRAGPAAARNLGAFFAHGKWVAFLDSDDVWFADHIENAMRIFDSYDSCELVISNFTITDAQLNPRSGAQGFVGAFPAFRSSSRVFSFLFRPQSNPDVWHGKAEFQALFGNFLQPSGLVIRKPLFEALGGFQESLWRCEDMEFLMRLVIHSQITMSMSPTYYWRQQQETSLASDSFAPLLKSTGLRVMCANGLKIVIRNYQFFPVWILSIIWMFFDWISSMGLRKIRQLEADPANQAFVQSAVALLNMAVPIALGRLLGKEEFGHFRSFGLYLSSVTALSLTSGLWSLIPWWKLSRTQGAQMVSTAWHLQCVAALLCALSVLIWAPLESTATGNNNVILALSAGVLLPSVFLEQHFNVRGRGLLSACIVGISEVAKTATMILLIFWQQALSHVLVVIPVFLLVRFIALKQLTREIISSPFTSSSFAHAGSVLSSAWPVGVSAALAALAATFDRFFLVHRLTAAEFSLVAAGTLSFPLAALLEQSVMQHRLQEIAFSLQSGETQKCATIIRECIGKIAKFAVPWSVTLILFAPEILSILFAERYKEASGVMRIFAFANTLNCVPPDALSRAQGCSRRILVFSIASALLSIALVVAGYSMFGILGAVAGGVFAGAAGRVGFFLADVVRNGLSVSWIIPSQECLLNIVRSVLCLFILKMIAPILGLPHWLVLSAAAAVLIPTVIPTETLLGLLKGFKRGAEKC